MGDNVKIVLSPEFPKITFRKDKIEYSITDIRYLNSVAINTLENILRNIGTTEENNITDEMELELPESLGKDQIQIVIDVLLGIHYEMKKKGKNGFFEGGTFLILGIWHTDNKLTIQLNKDHAKYIREYFIGKEEVNIYAMIIYVLYKDHCANIENFKRVAEQYG